MDDEHLRDLFDGLGPIAIRRMFGGKGIYHDGLCFALVVSGDLLLKADETSAPAFSAAGSKQWVYEGRGRVVAMPYWSVPDGALDDPAEMRPWARLAYEAALRAPQKKPRKKRKNS